MNEHDRKLEDIDKKFHQVMDGLDKTGKRYDILLKKLDEIIDDLGDE